MNFFFKPFSRRADPFVLFIDCVAQHGNLERVIQWSRGRLVNDANVGETKDTQIPDEELPPEVLGLCPCEEFRGPSVYVIRSSRLGEVFISIDYDVGRDCRCGLFIGSNRLIIPPGEVKRIRSVADGVFEFWYEAKH